MTFLFSELRSPDGRWHRSWQGGRARHSAFAGDHAWLLEAGTRLAELTGQRRWSERAREVAETLLEHFFDEPSGTLYVTANDAEDLVVRPKDVLDGAIASSSSIAASALARVVALSGEDRYGVAAERLAAASAPLMKDHPLEVADMVSALEMVVEPAEVVVVGDRPDLVETAGSSWLPGAVLAWGEPDGPVLWRIAGPGPRTSAATSPADPQPAIRLPWQLSWRSSQRPEERRLDDPVSRAQPVRLPGAARGRDPHPPATTSYP